MVPTALTGSVNKYNRKSKMLLTSYAEDRHVKKAAKQKVVAAEGKRSRVGLVVNASNALMLLEKAQTLAC